MNDSNPLGLPPFAQVRALRDFANVNKGELGQVSEDCSVVTFQSGATVAVSSLTEEDVMESTMESGESAGDDGAI